MQAQSEKEKKKRELPHFVYVLLLLSVAVVWGYGFVATDNALESGIGPFGLQAARFLLAAVLIIIFRSLLPQTKVKKEPFTRKELFWGVICGAANFFGFFFQTLALRYTDTARSGMLTATYVILVPLASCLIYKKFSLSSILNALVFFIGIIFLLDLKGFGAGESLTILSSVFFAAQILLIDFFCSKLNLINFNILQMLAMGALGLIGAVIFEWNTFSSIEWSKVIFPVLFLGAFNSAYAYVVQTFAQRKVSSALTAILLSLESIFSVLFSLAFGKTQFSVFLAIGCLIMAAASVSASVCDVKPQLIKEEDKRL